MRPRVFPAEDAVVSYAEYLARKASMRPRVFPAEDLCYIKSIKNTKYASMRPRVFPAEDEPFPATCPLDVKLQ